MIRNSRFSGSWYPDDKSEIESVLNDWTAGLLPDVRTAGIAPHAGWYYSGRTAARVVKQVCAEKELLVIIGGHLPPGGPILAAAEDRISLASGDAVNRLDLINELRNSVAIGSDNLADNTVELVLAMAVAIFPGVDIMWLRAPADMKSVRLAEALYELTEKKSIKTGVIGSTDLTHYGKNYSFLPEGSGMKAVDWVKNVNDAGFISLITKMEYEKALQHAAMQKSACSAGAAAAAAKFAGLSGISSGKLIDYVTSYDIRPDESFVGYAGIVY
jgi:AmmeMemoRadiSam system protein B